MKIIISIIVGIIPLISTGQISFIGSSEVNSGVVITASGVKYATQGKTDTIKIYDDSFSLEKQIPVNADSSNWSVKSISYNLYSTNNTFGYLLIEGNMYKRFSIKDEQGNVLFSMDTASYCEVTYDQHGLSRVEILACNNSSSKWFYDLPGGFPCNSCSDTIFVEPDTIYVETGRVDVVVNERSALSAYPNPTAEKATVRYYLPNGETEGTIVLFDMSGKEVKRIAITNFDEKVELSLQDLNSGTYHISLITSKGVSASKALVVSH